MSSASSSAPPEPTPRTARSTGSVTAGLAGTARDVLLAPVRVAQLFTQAKSFSANPVIGSVRLNRLGLHVGRVVIAHGIMRARMAMLARGVPRDQRRRWYRDGYLLVPDAFDAETFARLRAEVRTVDAEVRECVQGDTLTHRIQLEGRARRQLPACVAALDEPRVRALLRFTSAKASRPIAYVQTIKNGYVDGPPDPQKRLHSDTFHPTMKSWYFLDDVDGRNGPFTYVPGSQRLTRARLAWEYRRSIEISAGAERYSGNGSLRLDDEDMTAMGLAPAKAFVVPANTLIIANTHGFHCRGAASERSTRTELWTIGRSNPFNPSPGIDLPWVDALQHALLARWRRHQDRRAAARGTRSSWHVVEARNTIREPAPGGTDAGDDDAGRADR